MKTPNSEQQMAISATGGVLLKAGAGSGKTFVLVEHIIGQIELSLLKNPNWKFQDWRNYFSKLAVVTFTKKAAAEMGRRLAKRIEEKSESDLRWSIIQKSIPVLNLTTIHGLCFKLISEGEVEVPAVEMVQGVNEDLWSYIYDSFENYDWSKISRDIGSTLWQRKIQIAQDFYQIFNDPIKRRNWKIWIQKKESEINISPQLRIKDAFNEFLEIQALNEWKEGRRNANYVGKSWANYLNNFITILEKNRHWPEKSFNEWKDFFAISKGAKASKSEMSESDEQDFKDARVIVSFIKENLSNFEEFLKKSKSDLLEIIGLYSDLFLNIDQRCRSGRTISYSDLEFYVREALDTPEVMSKLSKRFDGIYIDEFQDTSELQFQIFEKLCGGDLGKLYLIGDPQQAIYGFRGGEMAVFHRAEGEIPNVISLLNNYRSNKRIIEFNNRLYSGLFPIGRDFSGRDPAPLELQEQKWGGSHGDGPGIFLLTLDGKFEDKEGMSYDLIEAKILAKKILDTLQNKESQDSIAILYRKISGAKYLLPFLSLRTRNFSFQLKVSIQEDPILHIFYLFLIYLHSSDKESYVLSSLSYLEKYLGWDSQDWGQYLLRAGKNDLGSGVLNRFKKLLLELNIHSSEILSSWPLVVGICDVYGEDLERMIGRFKQYSNQYLSLDIQKGSNPLELQVMTVHASKGLQFDHVFLGGIFSNHKTRSKGKNILGTTPMSFSWYKKTKTGVEKFSTPECIIEDLVLKEREFSESKRLLYVATTRAEKSLSFVQIPHVFDKKKNESWGAAFSSNFENCFEYATILSYQKENIIEWEKEIPWRGFIARPTFHFSSLGAQKGSNLKFTTWAEVSVTGLAMLSECPRKFMLHSMIGISANDLRRANLQQKSLFWENMGAIDGEEKVRRSSGERGDQIHRQMAHLIKNKQWYSELKFPGAWILSKLGPLSRTHQFIVEEQIKFNLWGQMISGTPDLVLIPIDINGTELPEIWDFKTGSSMGNKTKYEAQLKFYAYSLYQEKESSIPNSIILKLAYIDEKKIETIHCSREEIFEFITQQFDAFTHLERREKTHCEQCQFMEFCHLN